MTLEQTAGAAAQSAPTQQQRLTLWYILRRWPILPVVLIAILVTMGLGANWIAPNDPIDQSLPDRNAQSTLYRDGSPYLFGGDHVGRDVLSRVIHGARVSLSVMAVALSAGDVDWLRARTASGLCGRYRGRDHYANRGYMDGFPLLIIGAGCGDHIRSELQHHYGFDDLGGLGLVPSQC